MSAASTQADPAPPRSAWAGFRRSAIFTTALCTGIAVLLTVIDRSGFKVNLIYSFSIGLSCWLIIDAARYAVAHLLTQLQIAKGQAVSIYPGFPGWGWMVPVMLLGMISGRWAARRWPISSPATDHSA